MNLYSFGEGKGGGAGGRGVRGGILRGGRASVKVRGLSAGTGRNRQAETGTIRTGGRSIRVYRPRGSNTVYEQSSRRVVGRLSRDGRTIKVQGSASRASARRAAGTATAFSSRTRRASYAARQTAYSLRQQAARRSASAQRGAQTRAANRAAAANTGTGRGRRRAG